MIELDPHASQALSTRRHQTFDLGDDEIFTQVQGRGWDQATAITPAGLEDLISGIGNIGQLQSILLEELPDGVFRLVSGERRLRAMRYGHVNYPDNPHFETIFAIVVDGPLSEEDRLTWQLVENECREDLKPGELAAALLYRRSAVLVAKLEAAGVDIEDKVLKLEDPIERWEALTKVREKNSAEYKLSKVPVPCVAVTEPISL